MRELKQNWKDIFGGFKLAFDLWKIVLALAGIVLTVVVLVIGDKVPRAIMIGIFGGLVALAILYALINMMNKATKPVGAKKTGVFLGMAAVIVVLTVIFAATESTHELVKLAIGWIFIVAVWALFGGAITRIAAVEIATDDRIGLSEAFRFALRKYKEYILAPVLALAFMALLALLIWLGMIVCSIPVLGTVLLIIVIFPLVILAAFIFTLVLIGLIFGFPLMWPTVSTEGSDSFDALSRSYSYLYSRPWKYIWYNLVAVVYALACLAFVTFFFHYSVGIMQWAGGGTPGQINAVWPHVRSNASKMLGYAEEFGKEGVVHRARAKLSLAAAPGEWVSDYADAVVDNVSAAPPAGEKGGLNWHLGWAKYIMSIGLCLYAALFAAFICSLALSLCTTIYFLLRKDVDGTEMTEVFVEEEEEETPEPAGFDAEGESASAEKTEEEAPEEGEEGSQEEPSEDEES